MRFIFKIDPVAKGRPRLSTRGGFARAYTPAKTRHFESKIKEIAREQYKSDALTCPLSVKIQFFFAKPKSVKRLYPTIRPDLDNVCKSFLDALNGILFEDDSQIVKLEASKLYSAGAALIILEVDSV